MPRRASREPTRATSPPASTAEPPITVAKALGILSRCPDPTIAVSMVLGSFSPPQLDANTYGKARRRREHAGRKQGKFPLAGHTRVHPVHEDRNEGDEGRTRSTMDPVLGPWTVNLRPP